MLIGGVGLAFELTVRMSGNPAYRAGVGLALAAGIPHHLGQRRGRHDRREGNPYNLLFGGVILSRSSARSSRGSARREWPAPWSPPPLAHGAVAAGLSTDLLGGMVSAALAGLWLLSAWLFRKAAREQALA